MRRPDRPHAAPLRVLVENEGAVFSSPLADNPYRTLSPHVAGMTAGAMRAASDRLVEEFGRFVGEYR